ncbi:unnamed protein product [Linum tenue]|uniref:Uncharacterized protein n=1 Tax=Linum tenue TaxID=586396 RepID=A0AAV0PW14_9ROSI|nr:unnamed protein product [Linum tenue]
MVPIHALIIRRLASLHWRLFLQAAAWTTLLSLTVAVASFAPELAFVSSVSSSSSAPSASAARWLFSRTAPACTGAGMVGLPIMESPREVICLPGHMVKRSNWDFFVPTVFAALVVSGSACLVRSLGLWGDVVRQN